MATLDLEPVMASEGDTSGEGSGKILFCPFCRECFDGETQCPEHELALVDFTELPPSKEDKAPPAWEEAVDPWDIRFGRGFMALGALLLLVGFFLPFASAHFEDIDATWTGYEIAISRSGNLWTIPFMAAMFSWFLFRRRTPIQMLGTRLSAMVLAFAPLVSLGYTMVRVQDGVERAAGAVALEWGAGVYVIPIACVLCFLGGLRFGVIPVDPVLPHGAEADHDEDRGIRRD
ncbi:MAG: hypothetical protein AB7S26_16015 [Sandaracinaceae bacterium]